MVGTVQDITERKQAEEALARLLKQTELILNTAGEGIYGLDLEGRTTFVNPAAARMLGWEPDELLRKSMHETLHHSRPDGSPYPRAECPIHQAFVDARVHHAETEYFWTKDGTSFPVEYIATPIRDEQGKLSGAVVTFNDITERKQAEEALRDSEERYRLLFEGNPQPMWVYDLETLSFLAVNEAAVQHYGYSREEFLALTIEEIRPTEDIPALHNVLETLSKRNGSGTRKYRWKHQKKDGTVIDVEITSHELAFAGRPARLVLASDVTDRLRQEAQRRRAEEALRKSQQNYKALVNSLEGIVWESDAAFQFTFVSKQAERLLGYPIERWLTDPLFWKDHIHTEDRDWAVEYSRKATSEKRDHALEYRMMAADGRPVWFRDMVTVVVDDGRAAKRRGVMVDITTRKQAEEELNMLAQAIRSTSDCVSITDMEDNILFVNNAFLKTYGYEEAELIGKNIDVVRSTNNPSEVVEEILPATLRGGWQGELLNRRKSGGEFPIFLSTSIVRGEHGEPLALIGVARDIGERKLLEEQLRQAQKMEAVGRLAGGIAHDFNNLLTAILGYSDLVLSQITEADPLQRDVEEIRRAGLRASSLTRQLLAYSRRQMLQPEVLELNSVVANMDKMLRRVIGENIKFVTLLQSALGPVKADPGQIEQVILNLVINARDAMPSGGKLIIETKNVELDRTYPMQRSFLPPGHYVMLVVTDTGVGMGPETKSQIFEPFFTTKEIGKGTGLGLSTVYGIVKQSGGDISVYSEPGKGTAFKIYLPRVERAAQKQRGIAAVPKPGGGSETILLVEDEDAVRHLARDVLQQRGYSVLEAAEGEEALRISETHQGAIQLILTDVVMPGMNGRELASRVASRHAGIKILYMSGYTDESIVHHGILAPGADFLSKPFTPDILSRKVRQLLDK
jgi:PAS domain S-box-containing protein